MKPRVLFLIGGDPRCSPKPAEALRIAAGVGVWGEVTLTVCLRGPAAELLRESTEELVDGLQVARCLPLLVSAGTSLRVEAGARAPKNSPHASTIIAPAELARLAAECDYVVKF